MKRVFQSDLSHGKMRHMIAELRSYRDQTLPRKHREFLERLAEIGVTEAKAFTAGSRYEDYVSFDWTFRVDNKQKKVLFVFGKNESLMHREWYSYIKEQPNEADVNPIMMLEFGSGQFAQDGWRGTFPGQHVAFFNYWRWYEYPSGTTDRETFVSADEEGYELHESSGEKPRMPMEMAYQKMAEDIVRIADEVFSTD